MMKIDIINNNTIKIIFDVKYKHFIELMSDKKNIIKFVDILQKIPFEYYVIQSPCFYKNLNKLFEFVIINKPTLKNIKLNTITYKKYFKKNEDIAVFPNLTGDTTLIVPKMLPNVNKNVYLNISTFTRFAPINQQILLWKNVFKEIKKCKHKCFLNTHGLGIGWLHIRIDEKPKYYLFNEYKKC